MTGLSELAQLLSIEQGCSRTLSGWAMRVKMPVCGQVCPPQPRAGSKEGLQEEPRASSAPHSHVSRESPGHLDRWDPRVLEVSRGHQAPRAAPSRDLW